MAQALELTLTPTRRVALFGAIAYVTSLPIALVYVTSRATWHPGAIRAVLVMCAFTVGVAALFVEGALGKRPLGEALGLKRPRISWLFAAWLLPLAIVAVTVFLGACFPGVHITTTHPVASIASYVLQAMIAGVTLNLPVMIAEELGWRGLLFSEVQGTWLRKSIVSGLVWGGWLSALVLFGLFYPSHKAIGIPLVIVWAMVISPMAVLIRAKSESVLGPAVFRGTLMALSSLPPIVTRGGSDLTVGVTSIAGIVATSIVLLVVLVLRRRDLKTSLSLDVAP